MYVSVCDWQIFDITPCFDKMYEMDRMDELTVQLLTRYRS